MKIKFDYSDSDVGSYYYDNEIITINPININRECKDFNTDFYTLLLHVINHEVLHEILFKEFNKFVSRCLDNLTYGNQTKEDIWEYWLS